MIQAGSFRLVVVRISNFLSMLGGNPRGIEAIESLQPAAESPSNSMGSSVSQDFDAGTGGHNQACNQSVRAECACSGGKALQGERAVHTAET
jgi:hypothetical protein